MNHMISTDIALRSARPASGHEAVSAMASPARPSLVARLAARVRQYRAVRRTQRALDRLSQEQLKDIGYRRVPDTWSKYERLP